MTLLEHCSTATGQQAQPERNESSLVAGALKNFLAAGWATGTQTIRLDRLGRQTQGDHAEELSGDQASTEVPQVGTWEMDITALHTGCLDLCVGS